MECLIHMYHQLLLFNITVPKQLKLLSSPLNVDREGRSGNEYHIIHTLHCQHIRFSRIVSTSKRP